MHIPDGFLDAKTIILSAAASLSIIGQAVAKTKRVFDDRQIPKMSVMAAFIFAAQMINFPIVGGTSGHLIGGALAAIMLGPWSAVLIMTTVLIIQCLIFLDGGFAALGANILIMGIVSPFVGWWVYKLLTGKSPGKLRSWAATVVAGWSATMATAIVGTLLISFSGYIPVKVLLPAMVGWHALIGVGEGLITATVIRYLSQVRSDMVIQDQKA